MLNTTDYEINYFIGMDVQVRRPCTYYVIDQDLNFVASGCLGGDDIPAICQNLSRLVSQLKRGQSYDLTIGIDAPRQPMPEPRAWYWRKGTWVPKTPAERGFGRHCEVVIKALGLGNPQWTRPAGDSPPWMQLGYCLFDTLKGLAPVYEVFPSASYRMLEQVDHPPISLVLSGFAGRPRDMLDACTAAYTVHAYMNGRGCEVGGGDGLGTIILPENLPVSRSHPVLHWPD